MGKKKGEENPKSGEQKEGHNLLGAPTFEQLENGRFRCVETGHELLVHAKEAYAETKHCRLGLIDFALARKKPPLNMFKQDPVSRSKLICKLTGDTINKTEEHIWKHINGKRFLNMLDKKEAEKQMPNGEAEKRDEGNIKKKKKKTKKEESIDEIVNDVDDSPAEKRDEGKIKKKKKKTKKEESIDEIVNDVDDALGNGSEAEDEAEFWMPPAGERWDNDDGGDRWGSDSESGPENEDEDDEGMDQDEHESVELSKRTKRMSVEIGPSSFASRKKKKKTDDA